MSTSNSHDQVHQDHLGWWYWDETWSRRMGRYSSEEKARRASRAYSYWLDNGTLPPGTAGDDIRPDIPGDE